MKYWSVWLEVPLNAGGKFKGQTHTQLFVYGENDLEARVAVRGRINTLWKVISCEPCQKVSDGPGGV